MKNELKTGNVTAILATLATMKCIAVEKTTYGDDHRVTVSTDTTEIDAARAKMDAERNKHNDPRIRDQILCRFQCEVEYRMGAWHYSLSNNIYGWCVGESMRSNISGGRFAVTPRGYTLEEAIAFGCKEAGRKNVRFTFYMKNIPESIRGAIIEMAELRRVAQS